MTLKVTENRQKRIDIFNDTVEKVQSGQIETNSKTTRHNFKKIRPVENTGNTPNIEVVNLDTVSAIVKYSDTGRVCALNMASARKAGGGVRNGMLAQEECLFRCSNLFETVIQTSYPLQDQECLYTKDSVFFKDVDYNMMEPVVSDVVTVAAVNLNSNSYFDQISQQWVDGIVEKKDEYEDLTKNKMRLMLTLSKNNEVDTIILGAWGCGVFKNEPTDMARMFKEVLIDEGYGTYFKNVIFAVINDAHSQGENFHVFNQTF